MRTLIITLLLLPSILLTASPLDSTRLHSPESIVSYCLELISVDKGQKVDTAALHALFAPKAQLSGLSYPEGKPRLAHLTISEFIPIAAKVYPQEGFSERQLKVKVEEYNNMAQVFQSYRVETPSLKENGMNAYHLVYYQNRWWITSITWSSDANGVKLPKKYRGK